MGYREDRKFTDFVHTEIAIPKIYNLLGWDILEIDAKELELEDVNNGVDYFFNNEKGSKISVQERFRDNFYRKYNDATLRYRRDNNPDPARRASEFYKIKADYLVYGITNGSKFPDKRETVTNFEKFVVLDFNFLKEKFSEKKIKIVTSSSLTCSVEDDVLVCPENFNRDHSSSFIPFDVPLIKKLWGAAPIILQKGYF